jgi:hypothetical protein
VCVLFLLSLSLFFFFFVVLRFELRAYTLSQPAALYFFVKGFFEIGSCELFAWAVFEP